MELRRAVLFFVVLFELAHNLVHGRSPGHPAVAHRLLGGQDMSLDKHTQVLGGLAESFLDGPEKTGVDSAVEGFVLLAVGGIERIAAKAVGGTLVLPPAQNRHAHAVAVQ